MFLKISQNSQENTCVTVSFLIMLSVSGLQLYLKKRLRQRCFSLNFAKYLRIPFSQNTTRCLLLKFNFKIISKNLTKDYTIRFTENFFKITLFFKNETKCRLCQQELTGAVVSRCSLKYVFLKRRKHLCWIILAMHQPRKGGREKTGIRRW